MGRPMNLLHKLPYKFASAGRGGAGVSLRGVGPPWVLPPTFEVGKFIFLMSQTLDTTVLHVYVCSL